MKVIFGLAEYDQPKVFEAESMPRIQVRNRNGSCHFDTPKYAAGSFMKVIFGLAEYDQPKVFEAGSMPRIQVRNRNGSCHFDTPKYAAGSFIPF